MVTLRNRSLFPAVLALSMATAVSAQQPSVPAPAAAASAVPGDEQSAADEWDTGRLMEDVEALTADALPRLQARAEIGDPRSQVLLGLAHEFGSAGLTSHPREGLKWFLEAAAQGIPWAEAWAADFYMNGADGIERDVVRARALYTSAANRGHARAAFVLGQMYFHGDSVSIDMSGAGQWFRRAAREDAPFAMRMAALAEVPCDTPFCATLRQVLGAMISASPGRLVDSWNEADREWNAAVILPGSDRCGLTTSDRTVNGNLRNFFCDSGRIDDEARGRARAREIADQVEKALPGGYLRTERNDGRTGQATFFAGDGYPQLRVTFNLTPGSAQHRVTLLVGQ